ncbi:hypothetical protein F4782DRAFT_10380 [Xylaria castorea]|nr:hypothetical protein F4782DRAFT_10380 [Xylaria castorea]
MADASCGPSNAFKGLARHIEQDRSHQQDRVVPSSQQPAQTFRSTPLNSGVNDRFWAFQQQNAVLPLDPAASGQLLPHLGNLPSHPAQTSPLFQPQPMQQQAAFAQSATGDWINDFQRMNFSNTHARPLHNQPVQVPVVGQHNLANSTMFNSPSPLYPAFQFYHPPSTGLHPMQAQFSPLQAGNNMHTSQSMDNASLALDAQVEAQLEQEFENAMDDWMLQNGSEDDDLTASLDAASAESPIHEATEEESEGNEEQETELARAAQQLVDLLADNDTEKFKNSEFVSLMRRIASRQLTVQGNDLVETSPTPPGTDTGTASATPSTTSHHQPVSTICIRM